MIHLIAYLSILTLAVSRQVSKMTELPENYMTLNKGKKRNLEFLFWVVTVFPLFVGNRYLWLLTHFTHLTMIVM